MSQTYRLLGMMVLCSGCVGLRTVGSAPLLERPTYAIRVDPSREGSEVTVAATVSNTSSTRSLDLKTARISHLSRHAIELAPTAIRGACLKTALPPQQSCSFLMRYDVPGSSPFPSKWEFVLDGEVVQFTLDD